MKNLLRWSVRIGGVLAAILILTAGYLLLLHGRAPAKRPDLVRLPAHTPEAPRGYPTSNALLAAYLLGRIELHDIQDVPLMAGVVEHRGLAYREVAGHILKLDLHLPQDPEGPLPLLVFIHGGGWSKGFREDYHLYTMRFARQGYAAATVSYRLSPGAVFPDAVEDVKCAVGWLQANSVEYGIDPERVIVIGGSAGGYLALMAGLTDADAYCGTCETTPEPRPRGIVNLYGPTDLTAPEAQEASEVTGFLGTTWASAPERFAEASPITHLAEGAPPTLIIHGTLDQVVPVTQADALAERMQDLGLFYWYDRLDGYPHTMDITPPVSDRVEWLVDTFAQHIFSEESGAPDQEPGE